MTTFYATSEHERPDLPFPVPADTWMWQVGDNWCAVVGAWHQDWWEGADDDDIAARPDPWQRPIADVPTTGTLVFRDEQGEVRYVPTPGAECEQPGHEGVTRPGEDVDPGDLSTHRVRILAPQEAVKANDDELCCGGCAAKLAEAYVGFGWDVEVAQRDRVADAVESATKCPNCCQVHGVEDVCFLGMLLGVLHDRLAGVRDLTDEDIERIMREADPDYLWEQFGGPAVDYIEDLIRETA